MLLCPYSFLYIHQIAMMMQFLKFNVIVVVLDCFNF